MKENITDSFMRPKLHLLDVFVLLVFSVLSLFFYNLSAWMALIYFVPRILFSSIDYPIYLVILFLPNLGIMSIGSLKIINIFILVGFLRTSMFYRFRIRNFNLMCVGLILIIYELFHGFLYSYFEFFQSILWSTSIVYVSLYSAIANSYKNLKARNYFLDGMLVSIIYGVFARINTGLGFLPESFNSTENGRFKGGLDDPNYFSLFVIVSISMLLVEIFNEGNSRDRLKTPTLLLDSILIVFLLYFGIISMSRMFLIVFLLLLFLSLSKIFTFRKSGGILLVGIFLVSILLLIGIELTGYNIRAPILLIWNRIEFGSIQSILGGRWELLQTAWANFLHNSFFLLFGVGVQSYGLRIGTYSYVHNYFMEILVTFGIFGGWLYLYFLFMLFKSTGHNKSTQIRKRVDLFSFLPIVLFLIGLLSLNAIEVDSFYFAFFFLFHQINSNEF